MRLISKYSIAALFALASICSTVNAGDPAVVIHPRDIVSANARNGIVAVSLNQTKSKEVLKKGKQVPIEFSFPNYVKGRDVFMCEIRRGPKSATISFRFTNDSSAVDFAERLMEAREKALSECNCH
jgi:hypothetical protein